MRVASAPAGTGVGTVQECRAAIEAGPTRSENPVRSVQHFKALCCVGLPPQAAMVAIAEALHHIISSDWNRIGFYDENGRIGAGYAEHPECIPLMINNIDLFTGRDEWWNEHGQRIFSSDAVGSFLSESFHNDFMRTDIYNTIDRPLGSKYILDSMQPIERGKLAINLVRSHRDSPFSAEDARRLRSLQPWISHALRERTELPRLADDCLEIPAVHEAIQQATLVLDGQGRTLFRSVGAEYLVSILGGMDRQLRSAPFGDLNDLPVPLRKVVTDLLKVARGQAGTVPAMSVSTKWGTVVIEATRLVATAADVPETAPIAVRLVLREHAVAYASRILRGAGATPAQVRVGILLALGKRKPDIARELGLKVSTVEDSARKLYARLGAHTAGEFSSLIWLAGSA